MLACKPFYKQKQTWCSIHNKNWKCIPQTSMASLNQKKIAITCACTCT